MIGANIGECAPITTDYIWRARDKGAKLIVADPRFTPIARNADLYLPVRPGTDLALLMAMLHVIIRDGLDGPRLHRGAHHGVREDRGIGEAMESAARGRGERGARPKPSRKPRIGSANRGAPC